MTVTGAYPYLTAGNKRSMFDISPLNLTLHEGIS